MGTHDSMVRVRRCVICLGFVILAYQLLALSTSKPEPADLKNSSRRWQKHTATGVDLDEKATSPKEFIKRRRRYESVCEDVGELPGQVKSVYLHEKTGTIYCHVPKAGCTFWKRVFNFVNNKIDLHWLTRYEKAFMSNQQSTSIFKSSRYFVHFNDTEGAKFQPNLHNQDHYPVRVLVARDPLERVLSSYLDKLYLPDFWHLWGINFARQLRAVRSWTSTLRFLGGPHMDHKPSQLIDRIIRRYREKVEKNFNKLNGMDGRDSLRDHLQGLYNKFDTAKSPYPSTFKESNFSLRAEICGKYLTFEDFVSVSIANDEVHWEPTHAICNPCQFRPTHVSLMSTFSSDAKVVLSELGQKNAIDDFDHTAQINEELKMIVDYFFTITYTDKERKDFLKDCITPHELAYRLWQNFVWRGYIDPHIRYVVPYQVQEPQSIKGHLLEQLAVARHIGLQDPSSMALAKKQFYYNAFFSLSPHTLETLVRKFKYDYLLFIDP